jgi:hypothetical protein
MLIEKNYSNLALFANMVLLRSAISHLALLSVINSSGNAAEPIGQVHEQFESSSLRLLSEGDIQSIMSELNSNDTVIPGTQAVLATLLGSLHVQAGSVSNQSFPEINSSENDKNFRGTWYQRVNEVYENTKTASTNVASTGKKLVKKTLWTVKQTAKAATLATAIGLAHFAYSGENNVITENLDHLVSSACIATSPVIGFVGKNVFLPLSDALFKFMSGNTFLADWIIRTRKQTGFDDTAFGDSMNRFVCPLITTSAGFLTKKVPGFLSLVLFILTFQR